MDNEFLVTVLGYAVLYLGLFLLCVALQINLLIALAVTITLAGYRLTR